MNKTASINKVARIHIARMEKRAMFSDYVKEEVASTFIQSEAQKERKKISSGGKEGLKFLQKHFGLNSVESFVDAVSKSDFDPNDPIQKMVAEAGSKAKSPGEAGDMLGKFANAYQKKDIEGMAKVVNVEKETMALVLLWYVKDNKNVKVKKASLEKQAFWNPFAAAPPPPPLPFEAQGIMVDKFLSVSGTVISEAVHYIGEGISWLWSIIPAGYAPTLPAGKAWSAIYFILDKAWFGIMKAGGMALGLLKAAIVNSTATFGIVSVLKIIGIAILVYYIILGLSWMSYQLTRLPSRFLIEFPLKAIWKLIKLIFNGAIKLTSWAYSKIKDVVLEHKHLLESDDPMLSTVEAM